MEVLGALLLGMLIPILIFHGHWFYLEWRLWNNGVCRTTGKPWILSLDTEGPGFPSIRIYHSGNEQLWVTFKLIDRSYTNDQGNS